MSAGQKKSCYAQLDAPFKEEIDGGLIATHERDMIQVMLSNVAHLTGGLSEMAADRHPIAPALAAFLRPYMRRHILTFGRYALAMDCCKNCWTHSHSPLSRPCDRFLRIS